MADESKLETEFDVTNPEKLEAVLLLRRAPTQIEICTSTLPEFSEYMACGERSKLWLVKQEGQETGRSKLLLTKIPVKSHWSLDISCEFDINDLVKPSVSFKQNHGEIHESFGSPKVLYLTGTKDANMPVFFPLELLVTDQLPPKLEIDHGDNKVKFLEHFGRWPIIYPRNDTQFVDNVSALQRLSYRIKLPIKIGMIPYVAPLEIGDQKVASLLYRPKIPITFMAFGTTAGLDYTPEKPNTCFVLETDKGARYYLDFPANMYRAGDLSKVQNVILTHVDPDHKGDLVRLIQHKTWKSKEKLNILTAKPIFGEFVEELKQEEERESVRFVDIGPGKHELPDGVEIETRWNIHSVPTIGLKLSYGGKTLGYSADHRYFGEQRLNETYARISNVVGDIENRETKNVEADLINELGVNNTLVLIERFDDMPPVLSTFRFPNPVKAFTGPDEWRTTYRISDIKTALMSPAAQRRSELSMNWFYDCDFILHEAWLGENPVHTDVKVLQTLPKEIRDKMYLVHTPDDFVCPPELKMLETRRKYRI